MASGISYIRVRLAWLGVDNAIGFDVHLQDLFNFSLGGAVKASAKFGQKTEDLGIGVALDRWEISVMREWKLPQRLLTIKRFHPGKVQLPSHMLSIDLAEISHEECIFIARLAILMIDILNPLLQSILNQFLRVTRAVVLNIRILCIMDIRIDTCQTCCA